MSLPQSFQGILWSRSVAKLDLKKDKAYIVHQILSYGSLNQLRQLKKWYSLAELQEVFLREPQKVYTPAAFNFAKNYILKLEKEKVNRDFYDKTAPRRLRQI
ncbi:hypothetical protein A2160_04760 [Candidatus Beckwithbacteria bacterium RBG_13_42_9]|uniref:DUF6922 domain-containing protein n=1 Tax=Candidatus Beckwithbacteria bacterium RBG_13_42_9 TaxID=1797457 RepID=A0A1F5E5V9_9BACT|nr:MAG: hypothetical protein A2160_04760 [Candidatus Beckwithbacteria bacterium RBG_13_42_9]